MGTKHKNLYADIVSTDSIQTAFDRTSKGKRNSQEFLAFNESAQHHLHVLQQELSAETWQPQPFRQFTIFEPKKRQINAPIFSDRVVHHALIGVIEPIFDATFSPWSFACRKGMGTHAGVKFVQSELRKNGYTHFLKTDFSAFFPSIDTEILHAEYRKKISCKKTLALLEKVIPRNITGIPIGSLTSQLSANIYGNILDRYLHHVLKVKFVRYMDDVVVFGNDLNSLRKTKDSIEVFAREEMKLKFSRWSINSVDKGINFIGYRIWPKYKLLRKSSVLSAKRKIKKLRHDDDPEALRRFLGSWRGHIDKADSHNLKVWLNKHHDIVGYLVALRDRPKPNRKELFENIFGGV